MRDEKLAEIFDALSDVRRLRALRFISERDPAAADEEVCACHVQEHLGLSQPATSYHMKKLTGAGLVAAERRGRWMHYRIAPEGVAALRSLLEDLEEKVPGLAEAV